MSGLTCQVCGGALYATNDGRIQCKSCGIIYEQEVISTMLSQLQEQQWGYVAEADGITLSEYRGADADLGIPSELDGKPVRTLGKGLLYSKKFLRQVTVPEGVRTIESLAFCQCIYLEEVSLPTTLRQIGSDAFTRCHSLRTAILPPEMESIGKAIFSGCTKLEEISLPRGIKELPMLALYDCRLIKSLELPQTIEEIGDSALCNCSSLSSLILPPNLRHIGCMAFWGCGGLKELSIPASVTSIEQMAFDAAAKPLLLVQKGSYAARWAQENAHPHRIID